jgi:hypothetical protein
MNLNHIVKNILTFIKISLNQFYHNCLCIPCTPVPVGVAVAPNLPSWPSLAPKLLVGVVVVDYNLAMPTPAAMPPAN